MREKFKICAIICLSILITGCSSTFDNEKKLETNVVSNDENNEEKTTEEKVMDFIIDNQLFSAYIDGTKETIGNVWGAENIGAVSINVNFDGRNVVIEGETEIFQRKETLTILNISVEEEGVKWYSEHIVYEAFTYKKPNEKFNPDSYCAFLKGYKNSVGDRWLELNCYFQFIYKLAYDEVNDIFVDDEIGSLTRGNEMIFKKDLDKELRIAYAKLVEKEKVFDEDLKKIVQFIENEIFNLNIK